MPGKNQEDAFACSWLARWLMGKGDTIYSVINFSPSLTPLLPLHLSSLARSRSLTSHNEDVPFLVSSNGSPDGAWFAEIRTKPKSCLLLKFGLCNSPADLDQGIFKITGRSAVNCSGWAPGFRRARASPPVQNSRHGEDRRGPLACVVEYCRCAVCQNAAICRPCLFYFLSISFITVPEQLLGLPVLTVHSCSQMHHFLRLRQHSAGRKKQCENIAKQGNVTLQNPTLVFCSIHFLSNNRK